MAPADGPDPTADPFRPPAVPTEVHCLHCGQEYQSYLIEWIEQTIDGEAKGFWCCPTEGCDGKGFGFDLLPTDPDYVSEDGQSGWVFDEDEDDDDYDDLDDIDPADELVDLDALDESAQLDELDGPPDAGDEDDIPW